MSDIFSSLEDLEITQSLSDFCVTDENSPLCVPQDPIEESPLCVPQDPIEDIEFFPNFMDDPISLTEAFNPIKAEKQTRVAFQDCNGNYWFVKNHDGNVNYKQRRSKREGSKRAWSMNGVSFARERIEEPRRKCSHCETTETPQWRVGPRGPKTLCNACGVRYKSGRLLPEYRPAASPTFNSEKFSNFHKKILKKKGLDRF